MSSDEYKRAKEKWLDAKKKYDESISLFDNIFNVVIHQQEQLNIAFAEFSIQQALQVQRAKNSHIKPVKEK
ncbi:MAG TPA: hypothetical protein VNX68_07895 [Nitrosopumilaceae archaeon]|jgi:hypothetical protein|nr:hypothetical protein [Nitrosopumilaceae archaeon]